MPSFLERYARSYQLQLADFITAVETGRTPEVTFEDGRQALLLADAASEAFRTGRVVRLAV
jgi:myo-inositol 2-dehydrogenase/D-chiro-inositol 1-dehydrogenase